MFLVMLWLGGMLGEAHAKPNPKERFPRQFITLLEAGGWTPTPTNSARYQLGDVFDISNKKKIYPGEKCFSELPAPLSMSDMNIVKMLQGGLTMPFGVLKGKTRGKRYKKSTFANTEMRELSEVEIETEMKPACVRYLQRKVEQGKADSLRLIRAVIQSQVTEQLCTGKEIQFGLRKLGVGAEQYEQCVQETPVQVTIAYQLLGMQDIEVLTAQQSQATGLTVSSEQTDKFGHVEIRTKPSGIQISMNGKVRGKTPLQLRDVAVGQHTIHLHDPCYVAHEQRVLIKAGETLRQALEVEARTTKVTVQLQADQGKTVSGAVVVDGKKLGPAPGAYVIPLCSKQLKVMVDEHTYRKSLAELQLKEGRNRTITIHVKSLEAASLQGKMAQIMDATRVYHSINRSSCLAWPSYQLKRQSGASAWGQYSPQNNEKGTVVASMKHCQSGKEIQLLRINSRYGTKYVPVDAAGIRLLN